MFLLFVWLLIPTILIIAIIIMNKKINRLAPNKDINNKFTLLVFLIFILIILTVVYMKNSNIKDFNVKGNGGYFSVNIVCKAKYKFFTMRTNIEIIGKVTYKSQDILKNASYKLNYPQEMYPCFNSNYKGLTESEMKNKSFHIENAVMNSGIQRNSFEKFKRCIDSSKLEICWEENGQIKKKIIPLKVQ